MRNLWVELTSKWRTEDKLREAERQVGLLYQENRLLENRLARDERVTRYHIENYVRACGTINRLERRVARWKRKAQTLHRLRRADAAREPKEEA